MASRTEEAYASEVIAEFAKDYKALELVNELLMDTVQTLVEALVTAENRIEELERNAEKDRSEESQASTT